MSRFNNNGKSIMGSGRPEFFPSGSSRRPFQNRGPSRPPFDDGEQDGPGDSVSTKLDRLMEHFDKFDIWRDETDRRFENLEPVLSRDAEPPSGFDDVEELEEEEFRGKKFGERGYRPRRSTVGFREGPGRDRDRRDPYGPNRTRVHGYNRSFDRPASCWDPPQRFHTHLAASDKPQRVKMDAPRFNGSDAANWVSRVQYYFDHLMMPEAQRLHYAVMLFDQPAAEWVFNYCENNDFVTWPDFLEDVRHRFDRQSFKDYFGLIAKLTQTGSVLEYHDTFEKYLNRVKGIPENELYRLFVAGLKSDIGG